MTAPSSHETMPIPGSVVEFFEAKEIVCGVCLAVKGGRLSILTEANKEINLAGSRLLHVGRETMSTALSRDDMVKRLAAVRALRRSLMSEVNVEELWSLLVEEAEEGFSAAETAGFVFSTPITDDHVAAVQRVLLQDRIYFQYRDGLFHARPEEKVEARHQELQREEEREAQLEMGSQWLQAIWNRKSRPAVSEHQKEFIDALKGFCLFGQDAPQAAFVKELFRRANIPQTPQSAFRLLVRLGIWTENENLYLHEQNISPEFPPEVAERAERLAVEDVSIRVDLAQRIDLRSLHTFTVDSAQTRDYDDALSLRPIDGGLFEVGVHIADAAQWVAPGEILDREAEARASSIYLPDMRIAMLPPALSEGVCSLQAGQERLALSFLLRLDAEGNLHDHEIVPSVVTIREQLTYDKVNDRVGSDATLSTLHTLALKLKEARIARGAVILPLPEIQVTVQPSGMIQVYRYEKETPSQLIVSEWMIAANALAARALADRGIPGIFRGQAECRQETDFTQSEHVIFRIWRQRRLFARAELEVEAKPHCSLGLDSYTTVTSPIRRYSDLVVQRQIKHALATGAAFYSAEDLRQLIVRLAAIQSKVAFIQRKWTRFWILKYMEQEDLQVLNALVLETNGRFAHLLVPEFLMETNVPISDKSQVQRGEMIRVRIEKVNPREDMLRVQLMDDGR